MPVATLQENIVAGWGTEQCNETGAQSNTIACDAHVSGVRIYNVSWLGTRNRQPKNIIHKVYGKWLFHWIHRVITE